jgi:membrane protease YdiL (CAAX protease family)
MKSTDTASTAPLQSFLFSLKTIPMAWLLCLTALGFSGWMGEYLENVWQIEGKMRYGIQAIIMSGLVVPGIWFIRKYVDQGIPLSIGIGNVKNALIKLLIGVGFVLLPLFISLVCTLLFGWGNINFNVNESTFYNLLIGISITFLFEALPEELAFRGYIYSKLNVFLKRWLSALITVGLFVLLPIVLVPIQKHILGMDINVGGSNAITESYIITMIFFGSFVQYLRVLTKTIWMGIGFHLMFVYFNRMIGTESTDLIQFTNFTNETPLQIVFISTIVLIFIGLLIYPKISKNPIGWKETQI